ncbi:MAG: hypothetical protein HQK51_01895 [Oligoflexia bacterium]|nr:hypothetical protein [Oligoflexia bacterium]
MIKLFNVILIGIMFLLAGHVFAGGKFSVPSEITPETLSQAVNAYATQVMTCLHVEAVDQTKEQAMWLTCRRENATCIYNKISENYYTTSVDELQKKRDAVCSTIFEKLVDKDYCGIQFGNCGEGGMTNYCLAHKAGYKNIMKCESKNDHAFAMFLKQGSTPEEDTICIMDRWPLGPNESEGPVEGDNEYYFCNATLKKGSIYYNGDKLDERKGWYDKVSCTDWMNSNQNDGHEPIENLNIDIWKNFHLADNKIFHPKTVCAYAGLSENCGIKSINHELKDDVASVEFKFDNYKNAEAFQKILNSRKDKDLLKKVNMQIKWNLLKGSKLIFSTEDVNDIMKLIKAKE